MKNFSFPNIHHSVARAISDIHRIVGKNTGFNVRPNMSMDKALVEIGRSMRIFEKEAQAIYNHTKDKKIKLLLKKYMPKNTKSKEHVTED